jgi:serine/threonine-protein kinase HipA
MVSGDLSVSLYGTPVGRLTGRRDTFDFVASAEGVERFGIGSNALSVSVPLVTRPTRSNQRLRRNFFEEVLAEGRIRDRLAESARLDPDNTVGLLARYGRDVAGALEVWDPEDPLEPRVPRTEPVSDERILAMFDDVRANPLGNKGTRRLSSLAGVQDKILLARGETGWTEPLDGYPSTHILKPQSGRYGSLIFDEEYGSRFVRALGLGRFDTRIATFAGRTALVIERYDRTEDGERVHQEDFNQALGHRGDEKYERMPDGRLRAIAGILRRHAAGSEQQRLLRMVTLSAALGNLDMHAKNISVLHTPDGEMALAPMYDVVPQLHLSGLDQELSLFIADTNDPHAVTGGDLIAEGESWRIRGATETVTTTLEEIIGIAGRETPLPGAEPGLSATAIQRARHLLNTRAERAPRSAPQRADRAFPPRTADGGWGGPLS